MANGDPVCLTTYLTSRTLAHWQVTADGAGPLPRSGPVDVIAFHPEERRVPSGPRSIEAAKSHVVREGLSIERVRVVNRSKRDGVIYAAPIGYLDSLCGDGAPGLPGTAEDIRSAMPSIRSVAPGLMLVDRLLERAGQPSPAGGGRPFAVLIDLCPPAEEASTTRLARERLVIGVVMADPMLQPAVVSSVTDEPVRDVARLVLYEQKLPEDGPWILFNAADVLAAAAEVEAYPSEPEWSGFAIRHIRHAMLAASLLLAVGGLAVVAETAYRIRDAEARAADKGRYRPRAARARRADARASDGAGARAGDGSARAARPCRGALAGRLEGRDRRAGPCRRVHDHRSLQPAPADLPEPAERALGHRAGACRDSARHRSSPGLRSQRPQFHRSAQ